MGMFQCVFLGAAEVGSGFLGITGVKADKWLYSFSSVSTVCHQGTRVPAAHKD